MTPDSAGCEWCERGFEFSDVSRRARGDDGLHGALRHNEGAYTIGTLASQRSNPVLREQAMIYSRGYAPPSCGSLALSGALTGGAFGGVFGAAMALSQVAGARLRAAYVVETMVRGGVRNAAGFAVWSGLYRGSRCAIARARRKDDALGAATAGAFTGGVLSIAAVRGALRYNRSFIAYNAAASAMIALVFSTLSGM